MLSDIDIAQKLINGELKGLVMTSEYGYIPLRLTGTGKVERLDSEGKARIVDRRFEDFASQEWLNIYKNVPIVLTHPKNEDGVSVRAGYENGAFIGNSIDSFVKDKEVWVIARLHDKVVLDALQNGEELSTSPHFTTQEVLQEDGETWLEVPLGINSLAIVSSGFWDKKSIDPAIDNSQIQILEEDNMMEREVNSEQIDEMPVEQVVNELVKTEVSEGEKFQQLANEHKELEKGDDSMEEVKEEVKKEEKIDSCEKPDEVKEEEIKEKKEKIDEEFKEEFEEKKEEKADFYEDEEIKEDYYTDEDKERDEILKRIVEVADDNKGLGIKTPMIGAKRYKPEVLIKKFANINKDCVPEKYQGLIEKIDSSVKGIAEDMLNGMIENINQRNASARQESFRKMGFNKDGNRTVQVFQSERLQNK